MFQNQKETIQKLGATYGCHSCGSKLYLQRMKESMKSWIKYPTTTKPFISDHQPPSGVLMQSWWNRCQLLLFQSKHFKQALYPQCNKCSLKQSSLVKFLADNSSLSYNGAKQFVSKSSNNLISRSIVIHSLFSFRLSMLWYPFLSYFYLTSNDLLLIKLSFLQFHNNAIKLIQNLM